ncbi:MAG: serine hydrolase domain-containing protein [Geminicoccaceae bacterium]
MDDASRLGGGTVTLANWRDPPHNRWAFHHVSQIVPCAMIWSRNELATVWPDKTRDINDISFDWNGKSITVTEMLKLTYTDGFVVLHDGQLVHESYDVGMQAHMPHILFSVTKSIVGLVAGILAERGHMDLEKTIGHYLPEMQGSGYADATVHHVLDMIVGIGFREDYEAPTGDMVRYREASGWSIADPRDAVGLRRYVATLPPEGRHGDVFKYCSPNTDLLGWVMERASDRAFADLMSESLWVPIGAASHAYIGVDGYGAARTSGGLCTTTRDLARLGQLVLDHGRIDKRQIVPEAWLDDMISHQNSTAWAAGSFAMELPDTRYRSGWYKHGQGAAAIAGLGIYGQALYLHRSSRTVFAKHSSQPKPLDFALEAMQRAAFDAIAEELG